MEKGFLLGKTISLYRGSFTNNFGWGYLKKNQKDFIEVLIVNPSTKGGLFEDIYIKFSDKSDFIQLYELGYSSHGDRKSISMQNPLEESSCSNNIFLKYDKEKMIVTKVSEGSTEFVFLDNVRTDEIKSESECDYFNSVEFIGYPKNVYLLNYIMANDKDEIFICYYPKYYPPYSNYIFKKVKFDGEVVTDYTISNFDRYRDGGTTEISLKDKSGKPHTFYCPSKFKKDELPKFDGEILVRLFEKVDEDNKKVREKFVSDIANIIKLDGIFI